MDEIKNSVYSKNFKSNNNDILKPGWHGDVYGLPTQKDFKTKSGKISTDNLSTIFSEFDREMGIMALNIISKPNYVEQKDLDELFICYNICKLCESLGKTRNIRVGYYKYADLSIVESILIQHGLLPQQDEISKDQAQKK